MQAMKFIRRATAVLVAACVVPGAFADEAVIDEVIVTADYRERTLAELPVSVTVLGVEAIRERAVQHFEELVTSVPNMNWSGDGHRARYFQIRGVGELAQYQGAPNPSVGFIIDDIDFSGIGSIATLYDIERIEVLRGPQGTRYGANALAGLIYVQSAEPGGDFNGQAQVTAGSDNAFGAGVAVGGEFAQTAGYRVAAHHYRSDGFRNNAYRGRDNTNNRDETTLRGKVAWAAGEDWQFKLSGLYTDVDNGYDAFAIDNSLTVLSDKPGRDAQQSAGSSFRLDWEGADAFSVTSITSIARSDIVFSYDADWGNDEAWSPITYDYTSATERSRRTLGQEVRLASTDAGSIFNGAADWLVGIYINRLDEDLSTRNVGEYFDPVFNFADSLDDSLSSDFAALNAALFGQIDYAIGDNGVLGVGLRLERRATDYVDSNGLDLGPSENMIGGEIQYRHTFNKQITGFATIARGYKAGGFNLGFVPAGGREFGQESLWNFELGMKSTLADGALTLNGSVFYSLRNDQQVESSFQLDPNDPASFNYYTDNAAKGNSIGLEGEVAWQPSENWEWYASAGLLRAEFDDYTTPQLNLSGRDQAHAPRYTLAAGGVYRHASGAFARVDVSAIDEFYFDVSHNKRSEPYELTNVRLGYATESWTAQLFVRNLFDETYAVRGFYFGNEPPNFPPTLYTRQGDPRQLGVTVDLRF